MQYQITFNGKTYEFANVDDMETAQDLIDSMTKRNKASDAIALAVAGLAKSLDKGQKFEDLKEFNAINAELRADAEINRARDIVMRAFARKGDQLGVKFTSHTSKSLWLDIPAHDDETIQRVLTNARDGVSITFFSDTDESDETGENEMLFARIAMDARDEIAQLTAAEMLALNKGKEKLSKEAMERGVRVRLNDDLYPELVPQGSTGGSKSGTERTRYVKLTWNGKPYDGTKEAVAKQLNADGLKFEGAKVGERTVKLSKTYYSSWLDALYKAGAFGVFYDKYNKATD